MRAFLVLACACASAATSHCSDPLPSGDGLTVSGYARWPASARVCFLAGGARVPAAALAPLASSADWLTASASGGGDVLSRARYTVWEVARVGAAAREELVARYGDVLGRGAENVALLSPALISLGGGRFTLFSRVTAPSGHPAVGSLVWAQELGADLQPLDGANGSHSWMLNVPGGATVDNPGPEDPRAMLGADGSPLVIFNAQFARGTPRSMYLADVHAGSIVRLHVPGAALGITQKNWAPFWHDGALHMLFAADPLTVLRCAPSGACTCIFSAVAEADGGCAAALSARTMSRLRLGAPLTAIGDSGVLFTFLHTVVRGADARAAGDTLGYRSHAALLSTSPWGWLSVSGPLTVSGGARTCAEAHVAEAYPMGLVYPTTALLLGSAGEGALVGVHVNDAESTLQQVEWEQPLADRLGALLGTACLEREVAATGAGAREPAPAVPAGALRNSRGEPVPRCARWATLTSLASAPGSDTDGAGMLSLSPLAPLGTFRGHA